MKRYPCYFTQDQLDGLARLLYAHQAVINTASSDRPTSDEPMRVLTELRRQCCDRSGAVDPYPHMPHVPGIFLLQEK